MVYQQTASGGGSGIRDFLINRPPTVMFLLCLASCALATMSISFYFKWTDEQVSLLFSRKRYKATVRVNGATLLVYSPVEI